MTENNNPQNVWQSVNSGKVSFCGNCGQPVNPAFDFCQNCGAPLPKTEQPKKKSKKGKKIIGILSACVALVLVVAIVLSVFFMGGRGSKNNYAVYVKDNELFYTELAKPEPIQATVDMIDFDEDDNSDAFYKAKNAVANRTCMTDDGKRLFFIDKADKNDYGYNLYCRNVNKPDEEPLKLDSEVTSWQVNADGTTVIYKKGNDSTLYLHDLTDKEKIDSGVWSYSISEDFKNMVYTTNDSNITAAEAKLDIYFWSADDGKQKVDSEITYTAHISQSVDTVYYVKDNNIYKCPIGGDKQKVVSDVSGYDVQVYETGEMIYFKSERTDITCSDFVEDDMKKSDESMLEPECPDYPDSDDYDDYDDYKKARDKYWKEYDKYEQDLEEWKKKEKRDQLREDLKERIINTTYTLCYYNGKEEKVLCEDVFSQNSAADTPTVAFETFSGEIKKTIKISEMSYDSYDYGYDYDTDSDYSSDYISDLSITFTESLGKEVENQIAIKGKISKIDQKGSVERITSDGKTVYYMDNKSDGHGDVYECKISGDKPQKPTLYDNDVYLYNFSILDDGTVMYFKNVKYDIKGDLYLNKNKIDDDVRIYYVKLDKADGAGFYYMVDYDTDREYGNLKEYKDGDIEKIADDVASNFVITDEGKVLYLKDYSANRDEGDLYVYQNGESERIDTDVEKIVDLWEYYY